MAATIRFRTAVAGAVTVGLLGAAAVTATAAPASGTTGPEPAVQKTNTVTADRHDVRQWEQFRLHGKVTGIKAGTAVLLQQKQRGTWKTLPGQSVVNRSLDYTMRVKLGLKGVNQIRTVVAGQPSNVVTVTVR
ncbi:hypothetical protein HMPREF1486_05556 [Streptomyces sp. HPH0547]|uniref:hypothetical protein n=1 Tax=Streptomyces TaxID=1883 RepID=UPI00034E05A5|nr:MULTISPECIES: hypothetical protein [Streptomyces]EPD90845.1 hypothetical protein HMPREF1486_05556 [Streptomyces sp. HPH0547]MDI6413525.1 hypothetical protein [Streptomyces albus]